MIKDIENNEIDIGDLILIPKNSSLVKTYVLGFTSSKSMIISCARDNEKIIYKDNPNSKTWWARRIKDKVIQKEGVGTIDYAGYTDISKHNAKQYLSWIPNVLILKKKCNVPENLRKFIK